jgi:trimethylamine--corrinoid protein Co-methyltransferase
LYAEGIKSGRKGIIGGQLKILTKQQIKYIDYAAKEILSQIGVKISEQEVLKILDEAGCKVDHKKERVWMPAHLVDEAVRKAPKGYKFGGRDPKKAIKLEGNRVYFAVGAAVYSIDVDGKINKPTVKDEQDRIRVTDACENIDVAGAFRDITRTSYPSTPVEEMKLPASVRKLVAYLRALDWTSKPIDMTQEYVWDRELQEQSGSLAAMDQINIGVALRGSLEDLRKLPIDCAIDEPVSPLMHTTSQVERVLIYSKHGLPVWVGSEPMAGATSPVTLAGTLAQWTAECLSATVYSQMAANPEHRPPVVG